MRAKVISLPRASGLRCVRATPAEVVQFPRHFWHGPKDHADSSESDRCAACVLALCLVCRGAEAELPTDCPGRRMSLAEKDAVMSGAIDFKDGRWISK